MWYRTDLLFATEPKGDSPAVKCESCNVLFEAETALQAAAKAELWAERHIADSDFKFVGLENMTLLFADKPGDGTEIGGMFFEDRDVWERRSELIPDKSDIPVIRFEQHPDVPVRRFIREAQEKGLEEIYGPPATS